MERQPAVAIRNNTIGTARLAAMAAAHGAAAFELISTDKAINPTNVMGATKRLAELQLMAMAVGTGKDEAGKIAKVEKREGKSVAQRDGGQVEPGAAAKGPGAASASPFAGAAGPTNFLAVRFGNVLGSSGSVIPIF